jgi:RNA polymerase sigma-B factor
MPTSTTLNNPRTTVTPQRDSGTTPPPRTGKPTGRSASRPPRAAAVPESGSTVVTVEREAQRTETVRLLEYMRTLPVDDPLRIRLRDQVVAEHMNYARAIAHRLHRRLDGGREDVEQAAYLGLVKAVTGFDPGYGTGFLAYAAPTIAGEIKHQYRDSSWALRVPSRLRDLAVQLPRARAALTQEQGCEPTIGQLAEHLGASGEDVEQAIGASAAYRAVSLDCSVDDENGLPLGEFLGAEDPGYERTVDLHVLRGLVAGLPERDKRVLLMRYFHGMTQAEIGSELGLSQMHVSRTITRILTELRAGFGLPEGRVTRPRAARKQLTPTCSPTP